MMHEFHFRAMNTDVGIWLWNASTEVSGVLAQAANCFEEVEAELSRFRSSSGLSRLNAAAGQGPQPVSPLLWTVLAHALQAARRNAAACSTRPCSTSCGRPATTAASSCWPSGTHSATTPSKSPWGWQCIRLDEASGRVEVPAGYAIDLGGIAKGWTVDRVAVSLARHGPVLVDAGGDIRAIGSPIGEPWPVAVQDPFDETRDCAILALADGAVATSSIGRRRWQNGGQIMHHLIDPRTGRPSDSDLHTVAVLAETTEDAEVAAKTALMLGTEAGADWLTQEGLRGLLIDRNGQERHVGRLPIYEMMEIT